MSMTEGAAHEDAARLSARRAHVSRQLDLMLETRGPVAVVRRLVADLDAISEDLAKALGARLHVRIADFTNSEAQRGNNDRVSQRHEY